MTMSYMAINASQYAQIEPHLPRQRGNVSIANLNVINAILYVAEHGCKWRGLPKHYGRWHTIYMRMQRWAQSGVLQVVFEKLQEMQVVKMKVSAASIDSTIVQVHPDGTGALKKTAIKPSENLEEDGPQRCTWLLEMIEPS